MPVVNILYGTLNIPLSPNDPAQPYLGSLSMLRNTLATQPKDTQA